MSNLYTSDFFVGQSYILAHQISDALIDNFLEFDSQSKGACVILLTTGKVVVPGEVKSKAY